MYKLMERFRKARNKKGFTLIELIVVIVIIGILAAILIPRFTGVRENANEGAVIANLRNIQNAAEMVATENNVAVATVTEAEICTALGITDFATDLDGQPTGAVYDFVGGFAVITTSPTIYPAGGITTYANI